MRLLALALYRLVWFVPTLLGLLVVTFVISRVIPADPVALVAGETATPAQVEALRRQLGYDRPLPVQFVDYVARLVRGDMGTSIFTRRPIAEDLAHRLPATIELTVVAMVVSVLVGIPLGVLSALWRNSLLDHALRVVTVSGLAIASFWLGIMLQLLFAMRLGWTPLNGRLQGFPPRTITGFYLLDASLTGDRPTFGIALLHLALPAPTLAFPALATLVRFTRAGVLDVMQSNFVLYERAMGLPRSVIVWKYMLRSALTSTVTQIGLLFGILLAGAVVTEAVFDWPGIGTYAVNSILRSDYNAVMGFTVSAVLAPVLATHPDDVFELHPAERLRAPGPAHWLGADRMGADVYSRLLFGARITILIGVIAVGASLLVGVPIGLVAGYYHGWFSDLLMRVSDVFLAVPQVVLAIAIAQTLGPSLPNVILPLSATYWPWFARVVYAETRTLQKEVFVESTAALGASPWRLTALRVLPNIASPIIVRASIGMGFTILTAAALGFLGLGPPPPTPEWGRTIAESREFLPDAWWYATAPGLAIFLTVMGFNLLGDGLRDVLDPRLRRSRTAR